ncbi:MAG TPA: hypothetical protein VFV00_14135 [Acidimicrobiales bacterium]|nr:hypothetical protein [Acidimicrobiales bacterium]
MTEPLQLANGRYDVLVVDASRDESGLVIELTILSGAHKGEVVAIRAAGLDVDELDLLGLPGSLDVENGVPHFRVEK